MIAKYSMYSDIRNLEDMVISSAEGRLDVSSVISTSWNIEQLGSLCLFERELFKWWMYLRINNTQDVELYPVCLFGQKFRPWLNIVRFRDVDGSDYKKVITIMNIMPWVYKILCPSYVPLLSTKTLKYFQVDDIYQKWEGRLD